MVVSIRFAFSQASLRAQTTRSELKQITSVAAVGASLDGDGSPAGFTHELEMYSKAIVSTATGVGVNSMLPPVKRASGCRLPVVVFAFVYCHPTAPIGPPSANRVVRFHPD